MNLNILSKWVSSETNHKDKTEANGKTPDVISSTGEIGKLLQRIRESHNMLTVKLSGSDTPYTSSLLEIDSEKQIVLLDELIPRSGNGLLKEQPTVHLSTVLKGVNVGFPGIVDVMKAKDGLPCYRMPFPTEVSYQQRRRHFRASIPMAFKIPFHIISDKEQGIISGELRDLSLGGFGALISKIGSRRMRNEEIIRRCVIDLPDNKKVVTSLEVRYIDRWSTPNTPRIGARFLDMEKSCQHLIQHFVTLLDRQQKRKQLEFC